MCKRHILWQSFHHRLAKIHNLNTQLDEGEKSLCVLQAADSRGRTSWLTRMNMESLNNADIEFILPNEEGDGSE